jgi:hypothetical protein
MIDEFRMLSISMILPQHSKFINHQSTIKTLYRKAHLLITRFSAAIPLSAEAIFSAGGTHAKNSLISQVSRPKSPFFVVFLYSKTLLPKP